MDEVLVLLGNGRRGVVCAFIKLAVFVAQTLAFMNLRSI